MIDRILHALTSTETWTNIGSFAVGWALAELRAWVAGRLRLRRWREACRLVEFVDLHAPPAVLDAMEQWRLDVEARLSTPPEPRDPPAGA